MITTMKTRGLKLQGLICVMAIAASLFSASSLFAQQNIVGEPVPLVLTAQNSSPILGNAVTLNLSVDLRGATGQNCSSTNSSAVLGAYAIRVEFDRTRLQLTDVSGGTSAHYTSTPIFTNLGTANSSGAVVINATNGGNQTSPTGLVHVASLTFNTIAAGSTSPQAIVESLSSALQNSAFSCGSDWGPDGFSGSPDTAGLNIALSPPGPGNFNLLSPPNHAMDQPLTVTFTWEPSSGATSYSVFLAKSGDAFGSIGSTGSTSFTWGPLDPGTEYVWMVVARTSLGGTRQSSIRHFTTQGQPPCTEPAPPTLTAPDEVSSGESFDLSWDPVNTATDYLIEESLNANFASVTMSSVTGDVTQLSLTKTVDLDTRFYYRMKAHRGDDCDLSSGYSPVVSVLVTAAPVKKGVISVVGSVTGFQNAPFGTTIQLYNPYDVVLSGYLVYHPEGTPASVDDPSQLYIIPPGETLVYQDVLESMGLAGEGIGSLDLITEPNEELPYALVRIYTDGGESGTSGTIEPMILPSQALMKDETGLILGSHDAAAYRLNVGVRSLAAGATLRFVLRNQVGVEMASVTKAFEPDLFMQYSAEMLFGVPLNDSDVIEVHVDAGSAIAYGTINDNISNDPAFELFQKVELPAEMDGSGL